MARGTPAASRRAAGSSVAVEITLDGSGPAATCATLESTLLAGRGVTGFAHRLDESGQPAIVLTCDEPSSALDAALAALREIGAGISAVTIREPTLEDAFLKATGREFEPVRAGNDG